VSELEPSLDLMAAINEINTKLRFARAFHVSGQLLIEAEIWADDVNPANFTHSCRNVARITDEYSGAIHERFGGRLMFDESKTADYQRPRLPMGFAPAAGDSR